MGYPNNLQVEFTASSVGFCFGTGLTTNLVDDSWLQQVQTIQKYKSDNFNFIIKPERMRLWLGPSVMQLHSGLHVQLL